MAYRLKRDGQMVYVPGGTQRRFDGRVVSIGRGVVGRDGQVFERLDEGLAARIDAGELEGLWEVVAETDDADGDHQHRTDYEAMSSRELEHLVEAHGIEVQGTGAQGKVVKGDMVKALVAFHEQL